MKMEYPKEWFERSSDIESGQTANAGCPAEMRQQSDNKIMDESPFKVTADADFVGWFDHVDQTTPEHDPGPEAPCPGCVRPVGRHSQENPLKTISVMAIAPGMPRSSFFFRTHKKCWEDLSDRERSLVESSVIDRVGRIEVANDDTHPRTEEDVGRWKVEIPGDTAQVLQVAWDARGFCAVPLEAGRQRPVCSFPEGTKWTRLIPGFPKPKSTEGSDACDKQKHIDFWNTRTPIPSADGTVDAKECLVRLTAKLTVEEVVSAMGKLTDAERLEIIERFCRHCGGADPRCHCWNDE